MSASPESGNRALAARGRRAGPAQGLWARPMGRPDLARVAEIERVIYPFPWTAGNFSDSLVAGYDCWLFEEDDGDLVCYAILMWIPDEVHLLNLSVAAHRQHRGIGRAVLEWLCADAAGRGAQGMLLEVRPSNTPALLLYESAGFLRIGIRKRYYPAPEGAREDAWVMFRRFPDRQGGTENE